MAFHRPFSVILLQGELLDISRFLYLGLFTVLVEWLSIGLNVFGNCKLQRGDEKR